MYDKEDIKSIADFIRTVANEALTKEPPEQDNFDELMKLVRQLEAIRFNPRLFEDLLETYEVDYNLMELPLDQVALHINDAGILSKALVQWRCTNGK